ncbi:MAG: DUF1385 domain-containing protein [Patescibacteria group bacterium]
MEPDLGWVCGVSGRGRISIRSSRFSATAYCREGVISCAVEQVPPAARRMFRIPFPLIVQFSGDSFLDLPPKGRIIAAIGVAILICTQFVRIGSGDMVWTATASAIQILVSMLAILGGIVSLAGMRIVAPWHGAEHMAIRAYLRCKSADLSEILLSSRVDELCGTRLVFPLILVAVITGSVSYHWSVNVLAVLLVCLECMFQADYRIGFERIAGFRYMSAFLQQYLTTASPDEIHLLTAQTAMKALLDAHRTAEAHDLQVSSVSR